MDLTWLDPEHLHQRDIADVTALHEAARLVDRPNRASMTATSCAAELRHGWDGFPPAVGLLRGPHGRLDGLLEVWSAGWDNAHVAGVHVVVDPLVRRRGVGRALFEEGLAVARAQGRRVVMSSTADGTAGAAFLKAMGLDPALPEVMRRLDVAAVDWPRLDELWADAEPHAAGYAFERVPAPTPDGLLPDVANMTAAINDAPTGSLDIEDEVFPPERVQAYEQAQLAGGRSVYRLVARHRESGQLAGHTVAAVDRELPWWAFQHDTSVLSAHRGHRLGLLLKIGMLRWLREEEPQLRLMDTGNAADNRHMIAVNETLGYQVVVHVTEWQRHL